MQPFRLSDFRGEGIPLRADTNSSVAFSKKAGGRIIVHILDGGVVKLPAQLEPVVEDPGDDKPEANHLSLFSSIPS